MNIDKFRNELNAEQKILLAKYLYKNEGDTYSQDDILNDLDYEYYKRQLPYGSKVGNIPWDEVKFSDVKELLDIMELPYPDISFREQQVISEKEQELLNIWSKPRSIEMVEETQVVKSKFREMENLYNQLGWSEVQDKYILMLKLDGWNVQLYYVPNHLYPVLVTTRGRGGNIVVCTQHLAHLMPPLNVAEPTLVSGELMLDKNILTHLRVKYNRPFKNTRNSISSLIYGTIDVDAIKDHITVFAFDMQFESQVRYQSRKATLDTLKQLGFNVPPHLLFDDVQFQYSSYFNEMQTYYLNNMARSWECDGLVACPNYYVNHLIPNSNSTFQDGFMAVKMGTWSKKMYVGTVTDIVCPPSGTGTYRELSALITPTETADGRTVSVVPLKNLNRAKCINSPVDIGDEIMFTYHSKQVVKFRGKNGIIYHD